MKHLNTLHSLIESFPERGDRPAIVALREEASRWSYAEVADHVQRLARGLRREGPARNEPVILLADNRPEWIIVCLGVIAAGAVIAPVDVQTGDDTLRHIVQDSDAGWIFTTTQEIERVEELDLAQEIRIVLLDGDGDDERHWQQLLHEKEGAGNGDLPQVAEDDLATLFYTSGTTGRPKGVPLSHKNLAFQINRVIEAEIVTEADRLLLPLPLHHVYPFVMGMLAPLALGLPVILPQALTGPQLVRALKDGEVTIVIGVPRLYRALFSGIQERARSQGRIATAYFNGAFGASLWLRRTLGLRVGRVLLRPVHQQFGPQLRTLASGGSALDPDLAWQLEGMGWRVGTGYGLTETAPLLTLNPPGAARIGSAGKPIDEVEMRIDPAALPDEEDASASPDDASESSDGHHNGVAGNGAAGNGAAGNGAASNAEEGEILARGPNVFDGYHNLPEETEESLTDGWFRTGDLGYFDEDGYLHVTGRVSTLIVSPGGENIQPADVEEHYSQHPLISEVGVLQQEEQLVAVIVPEQSEVRKRDEETTEALRRAVEEQSQTLPSHQRIADYALTRQPLERTRLGKIRRHLLADRYEEAQAEELGAEEAAGVISREEMTDDDRELLRDPAAEKTWEWLAERVEREQSDVRLTPDSSLQFDLGIDSLEWVNLTMQVSQRSGVELGDDAISRVETVRDLLEEVSAASEGEVDTASLLEAPEERLDARQQRRLEPLGPGAALLARGMYGLDHLLIHGLLRLDVHGLEHLPEEPPYILAPNHISWLDAPTVAAALPYRRLRHIHWAGATDIMFSNPILRAVGRLAQTVPVGTEQGAALLSLAFGAAVLQRNQALVWFPEGGVSETGALQPFKPGIGMLLAHYGVPVIPVLLAGTERVLPHQTYLPRRLFQQISVTFGQPLRAEELEDAGEGDEPHERIAQALHAQMEAMADSQ